MYAMCALIQVIYGANASLDVHNVRSNAYITLMLRQQSFLNVCIGQVMIMSMLYVLSFKLIDVESTET
jgi:hypothetical protein